MLVVNNKLSMDKILLRKPTCGDIGWLIGTHGSSYAREFGFDQQFEIDIARKVVDFHSSEQEFDRLFIAWLGEERVGSVAISQKENHSSFVNFLLVEEQFRKMGIANVLIEKVLHYSAGHGLGRVFLETYSCLEDARNLYRKFGFRIYRKNKNISKYGYVFDQEFWEKQLR